MVSTRLVLTALLGSVLWLPGSAGAGILLGAGLGAQFHDLHERDRQGATTLRAEGDGAVVAYQLQIGLHNEMASAYALYSGTGAIRDVPPAGGERTRRLLSMAGGGAHVYLAPPANPLIPYFLGGAGMLFHHEQDKYKGRGPAYFAGMGLKFSVPFSVEGRYLAAKTEDGDRVFVLHALQVMFCMMVP
jgi:hypothetical protein